MNINKSSKTKHYKNKSSDTSPHEQLLTVMHQASIQSEYEEILDFMIKANLQKSEDNGIALTESAKKTIESAARKYILVAQLRNITPNRIKQKITESIKQNSNHPNWNADTQLEKKHNVMAGAYIK
ncbi:hypothetical protein [Proteus terrae]|uniref:hypothetical protein n=1 Tax=Proteus terrae TaxID=1574161 RepID=UPI00298C6FB8|nr:hypothetical protein [Proteus terrae]WPC97789.1 hypothetical protein R5P25_13065 [Proteus terrae]